MTEAFAAEYAQLVRRYSELAEGVRMIRRAVQRASHAGVLASVEPVGATPLQECEAIARSIYRVSARHRVQEVAPRPVQDTWRGPPARSE